MAVDRGAETWRRALEEDPHGAGTIDRELLDAQVMLAGGNEGTFYGGPPTVAAPRGRPWLEAITEQVTAAALNDSQRASALLRWVARVPATYPEGTPGTRGGFWGDFSTFLCGGTEEEVVRKGSPLAAELSRVLVTLAGLAEVPGRLVFLYADRPPYRHTVAELYVRGRWSVFDPVSDRTFLWSKHGYASAWEIQRMPRLVDSLQDHGRLPYVDSRFYATVAIAAYDPRAAGDRSGWSPLDPATRERLARGEAS